MPADPHPALPGLSDRQPRRRGRPPAARRLRRGRARARVRHARPTSSSRTTCAPARRRSSRPSAPARRTSTSCSPPRRFPARRSTGCSPRRGSPATSRPAASCALALRGGFDPARIYMHGNAKSVDELRFARESGVGHIVIDNADEIARLEAVVGDGPPQPVLLRVTPDVRGETNDKISTGQADSKFGFSMADAPARDRPRAGQRRARPRRPAHAHRLADPRARPVPARDRGDRGARRLRHVQPRRRPRRRVHRRAGAAADRRLRRGEGRHRQPRARPRQADPRRARPRARRQLDGDALHGAERQAQRLDLGRRRRRDVRQPAPDALRRRSTRRRSPTASAAARRRG